MKFARSSSDKFIGENFLLESKQARELYHSSAASLPIVDYHNHLSPKDIAEDRRFENLSQVWLADDHYKWRAMRACGVPERLITGNASDWEKFEAWAATVPKTIRNPLYHWTHLELDRVFGIHGVLLGPSTARAVWEEANAKLATPEFSARGILKQFHVEVACTTDDPCDSLEYHQALARVPSASIAMYPTFRPDPVLAAGEKGAVKKYLGRLGKAAGAAIRTYAAFLDAMARRHEFFHRRGCRASDHGLESMYTVPYTDRQVKAVFEKLKGGKSVTSEEQARFKSAVLHDLAVMDHGRGWVQQFHLGPFRNTNTRAMRTLGPNTGFDSIGTYENAQSLIQFLDRLDSEKVLAKTILYNSNPRDNEVFASMAGSFQDGKTAGKIQHGPAWWFLDQRDGILRHLEAISSMGVLSQFVGMTTDSRSLLSFCRHEYFRRILCDLLGGEMERGLLPNDLNLIGSLVKDVCYHNAVRYFQFPQSQTN